MLGRILSARGDVVEVQRAYCGKCACGRSEIAVVKQEARVGIGEDARMLGSGEAPIERHKQRAQPGASEKQAQEFRRIVAEMRDALAWADAQTRQYCRETTRAAAERRPRDAPAFELERDAIRAEIGMALEPGAEVHQSFSPGS